jgi:hypothetical protein
MAALLWFVGNRNPSITETITTAGGTPVDLTGATVAFKMRAVGSATLKVNAAATIVSPTLGQVRYDWAAIDVDTAGQYLVWWTVTVGSNTQDMAEAVIEFRAHAPVTASLCELADVRQSLELPDGETSRDALILSLIPVATDMLKAYAGREFTPITIGATRRFKIDGRTANAGIVDLAPYDLQSTTLVSLNPETASPTTLVAGNDYVLAPVQNDEGVYTTLRLSSFLSIVSSTLIRFNYAILDITGTWGFPAVPRQVNEACSDAVCAWMRRDVPSLGLNLSDGSELSPEFTASFDLPLSSIRKVNTYRRNVGAF